MLEAFKVMFKHALIGRTQIMWPPGTYMNFFNHAERCEIISAFNTIGEYALKFNCVTKKLKEWK